MRTIAAKIRKNRIEWVYGYTFIAPIVIGTLLFTIYPIIYSLLMSFTDWNGLTMGKFVGLNNFRRILTSMKFHREFLNTLYFTFVSVPISVALSVVLANALNKRIRFKTTFRVLYFLPNVTMPVAVALVWKYMFNSQFGIVNILLGFFRINGPQWMGDPNWIMPAVIIISIWGSVGYNMVIVLASMQDIPVTFYEAALIDGASPSKSFFKITVPLITPTLFFVITMSVMTAMKEFDIIYMFTMTGAGAFPTGPVVDGVRTIVFGIYEQAFAQLRFGLGSTEAVILFIFIMIVTFIQFRLQKKWVFYE